MDTLALATGAPDRPPLADDPASVVTHQNRPDWPDFLPLLRSTGISYATDTETTVLVDVHKEAPATSHESKRSAMQLT